MLTRRLEWTPRGGMPQSVEVEIGDPVPDGRGWLATLAVRGFDAPLSVPVAGSDPMQAVLCASWVAADVVPSLARGGRLTWNGGRDIGLTPPRLSLWRRLRARFRGWRWYRGWRRGQR